MRANNDTRRLFEGKPGKQVQARVDTDGAALELIARFAPPSVDAADDPLHAGHDRIAAGSGWRATAEVWRRSVPSCA